jgi:hypothetical protein
MLIILLAAAPLAVGNQMPMPTVVARRAVGLDLSIRFPSHKWAAWLVPLITMAYAAASTWAALPVVAVPQGGKLMMLRLAPAVTAVSPVVAQGAAVPRLMLALQEQAAQVGAGWLLS